MMDPLSTEVRTYVVPDDGGEPYVVLARYQQVDEGTPGAVELDTVGPGIWWQPAGRQPTGDEVEQATDVDTWLAAREQWQQRQATMAADVQAQVGRARDELLGLGLSLSTVEVLLRGAQ